MADEPDNLVLELLRGLRADVADTRVGLLGEINALRSELKSDMHSLRADVASDLLAMQAKNDAEHKATREQIVGMRRAVVEYHSAVPGHGALISDLEARVRRLEQKVGV
ncbi:hypothetical protein ACNHKD_01275 [Methylocystis sp. JAN1]|uniref:hypothetical protein n=1 Tax=Methylocystis sp. JAN1 TaxID=3397211 RepID=UPI003FA29986